MKNKVFYGRVKIKEVMYGETKRLLFSYRGIVLVRPSVKNSRSIGYIIVSTFRYNVISSVIFQKSLQISTNDERSGSEGAPRLGPILKTF